VSLSRGGNELSSSQILKGILEGCLLSIIAKGETYGYEMMEKLYAYGFTMVSEGSIYPLLLRMRKEGLVTTSQKELPSGGPKRKYYSLTIKGREELDEFKERWGDISNSVNKLLREDD
jgi:PadR family transcriptional regulator, regulatory protein PadR